MADPEAPHFMPQGKYIYNNTTLPKNWHPDENTHSLSLNLMQGLGWRHGPGSTRHTFVEFLRNPTMSDLLLELLNTNLEERREPILSAHGIQKLLQTLTQIADGKSWSPQAKHPRFELDLKAWTNLVRVKDDKSIDSLTIVSAFRLKYSRAEYFERVNTWFAENSANYAPNPSASQQEVDGIEPDYMAAALIAAVENCTPEARARLRKSLLDLLAAPLPAPPIQYTPRKKEELKQDKGLTPPSSI